MVFRQGLLNRTWELGSGQGPVWIVTLVTIPCLDDAPDLGKHEPWVFDGRPSEVASHQQQDIDEDGGLASERNALSDGCR